LRRSDDRNVSRTSAKPESVKFGLQAETGTTRVRDSPCFIEYNDPVPLFVYLLQSPADLLLSRVSIVRDYETIPAGFRLCIIERDTSELSRNRPYWFSPRSSEYRVITFVVNDAHLIVSTKGQDSMNNEVSLSAAILSEYRMMGGKLRFP
jgi:hypothetical protein